VRRLLHPFVLVVSAILLGGYVYIALRLTSTATARLVLAVPFLMVWALPVVYWFGDRDRRGIHEWIQGLSFLCMGWLSFLLVLTVTRDVLLLTTAVLPPSGSARWSRCGVRRSVTSTFRWKGWRRIWTDCGSRRSATSTWG
jgi:hypothetical protein